MRRKARRSPTSRISPTSRTRARTANATADVTKRRTHDPLRPAAIPPHRDGLLVAVLGQRIRIECSDPVLRSIFVATHASMAVGDDGQSANLCYRIDRNATSAAISI